MSASNRSAGKPSPGKGADRIACPHCQALIKSPALPAGSSVNCPKCGRGFVMAGGPGDKTSPVSSAATKQTPTTAGSTQPKPVRSPLAPPVAAPTPASAKPARKLSDWVDPKVAPLDPGSAFRPTTETPLPKTQDDSGFVPLDFATAAASTQPAHRSSPHPQAPPPSPPQPVDPFSAAMDDQAAVSRAAEAKPPRPPRVPDNLVDPNLLPPPPPRTKAKPTHVAVVCALCTTRINVPLAQIGQTIQCPDCHKLNVVQPPKGYTKEGKPAPPAKEAEADADAMKLSKPVKRPAWRPVVAARGEYEVLQAMDPRVKAEGWSHPDAKGTATVEDESEEAEEDLRVAEPVERLRYEPEPIKLPKPDPEASLYDGRYDDGVFGDGSATGHAAGWKRAPFLVGIVGFLFRGSSVPRWAVYALGLGVAAAFATNALYYAQQPNPEAQAVAPFLGLAFSVTFGLWLAPFCTAFLGVVSDTANGSDEIENWPDWNLLEWFYPMLFVPMAVFLSGLPGAFLTSAILGSGLDPRMGMFAAAAPLMLSWIALFPVVFYSMMAEGSVLAPISPLAWQSWKVASEGWMIVYMYSIVLAGIATAAGSFMLVPQIVVSSLGALGVVMCAFLYARLLGRLMWYSAQKEAKLAAQAAADSE